MPLFNYKCSQCLATEKHLSKKVEIRACKKCGHQISPAPRVPSSRVVETLDNGMTPKRLERPADTVELHRERREAHQKKAVE